MAPDVVLHQGAGPVGVPGRDGPGDLGVLEIDLVLQLARVGVDDDVVSDDLSGCLEHQLEGTVVGELGDDGVEPEVGVDEVELAGVRTVVGCRDHERSHRLPDGLAVLVAGRPLGEDRLGDDPRVEQLGVGAAGKVVEERRDATEVGGVDLAAARTASRAVAGIIAIAIGAGLGFG